MNCNHPLREELVVEAAAGSTSASLVRQVAAGDAQAWERFANLYVPLVYGWARQAGLQASDALDVSQNVFLSVLRNVSMFTSDEPGQSVRRWLRTITRNVVADLYREQGRQPLMLVDAADSSGAKSTGSDDVPESEPDSGSIELESECRAALNHILHLMPADPSKTVSTVGVRGMLASLEPSLLRVSAPPPEMIREYKLLGKIGEGGMGTVYKAEHTRLRRDVAIKLLPLERSQSPGTVARFDREMQAVGGLDHPNIVRAFDAGEHEGRHFLVMEFVPGCDASQLVDRDGPLPIAEACEIIRQAALGLQHAHQAGLVHRDIKPSNLMVTPEGTVKVLDLGLALWTQQEQPPGELTRTGQVMGTIDYMAPEQGSDMHRVDIRADVYSLGATLYKLLTGTSPFADARFDTSMKKLVALATLEPKPVAAVRGDVPAPLSELVSRMLAKSPDERPATPGEVATLLQPYCIGADLSRLQRRKLDTAEQAPAAEDTQPSLKSASADTTSNLLKPRPKAMPVSLGDRQLASVVRWLVVGAGVVTVLLVVLLIGFMKGAGGPPRLAIAPFEAAEARSHQQAWATHLGLPAEHVNSIGIKFQLIPPGEYLMGSTPEEMQEALELVGQDGGISVERVESSAPQHRVRIRQPFYLSVHEVTQQEYEDVQGANPSYSKDRERHAELPVETVTWNDAVEFCVKLSQQERLTPQYSQDGRTWMVEAGTGYRLPTEAEWELACRAGTTTKYSTGDRDSDLAAAAWFGSHAASRTHLVGKLEPNPFGLHDMHGNVSEWCQDAWNPIYYQQFENAGATDPQGPALTTTGHRITRGGGWMWGASSCRSSYRDHADSIAPQNTIGFRVVLPVEGARLAKSK